MLLTIDYSLQVLMLKIVFQAVSDRPEVETGTALGQEILESLMLCTTERDICKRISSEHLVAQFAAASDRRLDLQTVFASQLLPT